MKIIKLVIGNEVAQARERNKVKDLPGISRIFKNVLNAIVPGCYWTLKGYIFAKRFGKPVFKKDVYKLS